jgi:hypothetical protein
MLIPAHGSSFLGLGRHARAPESFRSAVSLAPRNAPPPGGAKANAMDGFVRCRVTRGITTVTAAGAAESLRGSPHDR